MLVNWKVHYLSKDTEDIQPPDKFVEGQKYWFFRHVQNNNVVDVIDFTKLPFFHYIESKKLKFYIFQSIKGVIKSKNYDLIISHGAQSAIFLAFMRTIINKKSPPHIVIDVGCFNGGRDNKIEISLIKLAAKFLAGVIYHATIQKEYYERNLPFLLKKSRFITFGVDTDFFRPLNIKKENYIVSIGYAKRDYNTLLKAWRKLSSLDTKLKIFGVNNPQELDVTYFSSDIELLGMVPIDKLKNIIARSRFIILPLPYYKYAYGQMTLLQCMSMGKAVIVTKTPSTIDYIAHGENALFVQPYDVDDMRREIEFLLANPSIVERLEKEARNTVTQRFNEKIMAQNIYKFINEII